MGKTRKVEFKTTFGTVEWDKVGAVKAVDDPSPPTDDPRWQIVYTLVTEARDSKSAAIWFWRREMEADGGEG